jgi:hypothetical protein
MIVPANTHLIYRPDTPTPVPYKPFATPDILDIVVSKDLTIPVYLTACSALSSYHLLVLIDTRCRSSFLNLPDCPDYRWTECVKFQASVEDRLPSTLILSNEVEIDTCGEEVSSAIVQALAA